MTSPLGQVARPRLESAGLHIAGLSLLFLAAGLAVCTLVDLADGGSGLGALALSTAIVGGVGVAFWHFTTVPAALSTGAVFGSVFFAWITMSVFAALPFVLSGALPNIDDALFESISGLSCTGATLIAEPESLDRGVLFWRQMTQWFGGLGVIVLAVAVLPFLGVGGLELIGAEAPGPTSDRLAPRVSETAKRLWLVYIGITGVIVVALLGTGLSLFDAFSYSFSVVSTGGFAPHAQSLGELDHLSIELVLEFGMLLGAMNFTLHWLAVRGRPSAYWRNSEWRVFLGLTGAAALVFVVTNLEEFGLASATRNGVFSAVNIISSAGLSNASSDNPGGDYVLWPGSAQVVVLFLMFCGGMSGSTSGGLKVLRVQVMAGFARRELKRARQPRAVLPIKTGDVTVPERVVSRIAGYLLLYIVLAGAGTVVVAELGADLVTATSAVASAIGNMGPALGDAGPTATFLVFTRPARAVLMALMLVGRLELYAVILTIVAAPHVLRPALLSKPERAGRFGRAERAGRTVKVGRTR